MMQNYKQQLQANQILYTPVTVYIRNHKELIRLSFSSITQRHIGSLAQIKSARVHTQKPTYDLLVLNLL